MSNSTPNEEAVSKGEEKPPVWPPPPGWARPQPDQDSKTPRESAPEQPQLYSAAPSPGPKPKRPYRLLAAMLIGSALAFPVAVIGIVLLLVFAGEHIITITEGKHVVIAAAVVAGAAAVTTAIVWTNQSRNLSRKARLIGWSLVVIAAMPGAAGAVYLMQGSAPQSLVRPAVTGRAEVGSVLTADPGRWSSSGGHLSFDYQWLACRGSSSCGEIAGATGKTYIPKSRDLHRRIRVRVSAYSTGGADAWSSSDWVTSAETAPVLDGH